MSEVGGQIEILSPGWAEELGANFEGPGFDRAALSQCLGNTSPRLQGARACCVDTGCRAFYIRGTGAVNSAVRVPPLQGGGRGFESLTAHFLASSLDLVFAPSRIVHFEVDPGFRSSKSGSLGGPGRL